MAFPTEALAEDHFQGLGRIAGDAQDNLVALLNSVRSRLVTVIGAIIDPDGGGDYLTIQAAIDAGEPIINLLAGKRYVGNVTPEIDRSLYIVVPGEQSLTGTDWEWYTELGTLDYRQSTKIVGDIFLPNAQAESVRRSFVLSNVDLVGDFTGRDNWNARFSKCGLTGVMWQENDVLGGNDGKGCQTTYDRCFSLDHPSTTDTVRWKQTGIYLDDGMGSNIYMRDCSFVAYEAQLDNPRFQLRANDSFVKIWNSTWMIRKGSGAAAPVKFFESPESGDNPSIDIEIWNTWIRTRFSGAVAGQFWLLDGSGGESLISHGFHIDTREEPIDNGIRQEGTTWFRSDEIHSVEYHFRDFYPGNAGSLLGGIEDPEPDMILHLEPANPGVAGTWHRTSGNLWAMSDLKMFADSIDLSTPAAEFPLGLSILTDDIVVGVSVRESLAVSGAGGAVRIGIGTTADPDKYLLTPFATPAETLLVPILVGGGETLKVSACDAAGAALGTLTAGELMVTFFFRRKMAIG